MDQLHTFHQTKTGYIVFAAIEAVLFYIAASIAIDTANMFVYLAAVLLLVGVVVNLVRVMQLHFGKRENGRK